MELACLLQSWFLLHVNLLCSYFRLPFDGIKFQGWFLTRIELSTPFQIYWFDMFYFQNGREYE